MNSEEREQLRCQRELDQAEAKYRTELNSIYFVKRSALKFQHIAALVALGRSVHDAAEESDEFANKAIAETVESSRPSPRNSLRDLLRPRDLSRWLC